MPASKRPTQWQAAKVLAHPLRARIQAHLLKAGTASPNELAKALGEPLTNVSYHVRMMHDLGILDLVDTEPRRGALEHYYRLTAVAFVAVGPVPRNGKVTPRVEALAAALWARDLAPETDGLKWEEWPDEDRETYREAAAELLAAAGVKP